VKRSRSKTPQKGRAGLGYGNPPAEYTWKPGQSGNKSGRPPGSRSAGDILSAVLRQKVTVTENGKTRKIPALEVILRRIVNDAMKGDKGAAKLGLALYDRYGPSTETPVHLEEMLLEDKKILADFLKTPGKVKKARRPKRHK
jgi:hypothetical protein